MSELRILLDGWRHVVLPSALVFETDAYELKIYAALLFYARNDGETWVSKERLSKELGMGRSTLFRKLELLEKQGWITRSEQDGKPVVQLHGSPASGTTRPAAGLPPVPQRDYPRPAAGPDLFLSTEKPVHTSRKRKKKTRKKTGKGLTPEESAEFERWWAVYPKHTNRPAARGAWRKAREAWPSLGALLEATQAWLQQNPVSSTQYLPAPASWLANRRWEDEPTRPLNGADPEDYGAQRLRWLMDQAE